MPTFIKTGLWETSTTTQVPKGWLNLTRLIKEDDVTKEIPVIIFSSLVNEEMAKKGEALGADAQLSKPEIGNLVRVLDGLVLNK